MAQQYSLKDISVITLKDITVDDDLREFIEKVNFNFDQILSVLDSRFYDTVSERVLRLIASGQYNQFLTGKPTDSVQWIGKPGRTGKAGIGRDGRDGRSLYVSKTEIERDSEADASKFKEGDVVIDKTGSIFTITTVGKKLYYTLQFKLSTGGSGSQGGGTGSLGIITTEAKYLSSNDPADHWILYDVDGSTVGSNNLVLASADDSFAQLYRLTIGSEKSVDDTNMSLALVNIPRVRSSAIEETFSPQLLFKFRKNYQSPLLPDVGAYVRYFDSYDSSQEEIEWQQLDMWTSANTGISIQSYKDNPEDNAVILNARKVRFIGSQDTIPGAIAGSSPELVIRVHKLGQLSNPTEPEFDLHSYGSSYVLLHTNEDLILNSKKNIIIESIGKVRISSGTVQVQGVVYVENTLMVDSISRTNRGSEINVAGKIHIKDGLLELDNGYALKVGAIGHNALIAITTPQVVISNNLVVNGRVITDNLENKTGTFITASQLAITRDSTIKGKTIYHAGNLNLPIIPFVAEKITTTNKGIYISTVASIVYDTPAKTLYVGDSKLVNLNLVATNLLHNGKRLVLEETLTQAVTTLTAAINNKVDNTNLIIKVQPIGKPLINVPIGGNGQTVSYTTFGLPQAENAHHANYVMAGDYKWLEIEPVPLLKTAGMTSNGIVGFKTKTSLQYITVEDLLSAATNKPQNDARAATVTVNAAGKVQVSNLLKLNDPVNPSEDDLILAFNKTTQKTEWKKNNPLPKDGKKPGRVLVLGNNNEPEWGNDYMHHRFFWNTKTNKLDRIDPSRIDFEKWLDLEGYLDLRCNWTNNGGTLYDDNEFSYNNYTGNYVNTTMMQPSNEIKDLDIKQILIEEGMYGVNRWNNKYTYEYYGYDFNGSGNSIRNSMRYIISVVGNVVTVYFWKMSVAQDVIEGHRLGGFNPNTMSNGTVAYIADVITATSINLPNYVVDYDNHGICFGNYELIESNGKLIENTDINKHLNLYLNCLPFNVWFVNNYCNVDDLTNVSNPKTARLLTLLRDKKFNHDNRTAALTLRYNNTDKAGIYPGSVGLKFYFKNFGVLNQVSWTLSNPISKEHYNFNDLSFQSGY